MTNNPYLLHLESVYHRMLAENKPFVGFSNKARNNNRKKNKAARKARAKNRR